MDSVKVASAVIVLSVSSISTSLADVRGLGFFALFSGFYASGFFS